MCQSLQRRSRSQLGTIFLVGLLSSSCGQGGEDTLRGSVDRELWQGLSPEEKFAYCLDERVSDMREFAARSSKPEQLNAYYPKWDSNLQRCRDLLPQFTQPALELENSVRIRMRQVLGELTEDYLAEMELVRSGHRGAAEAEDSWRTFAIIGIAEVSDVIPR
jgi:hypothetical protein